MIACLLQDSATVRVAATAVYVVLLIALLVILVKVIRL